jgi:fatty acid-binding protein DegV
MAVHHARARLEAEKVLSQIAQRRSLAESFVTEFTPVMGAYCGPGLVGAAFYAADRSEST